MANHNFNEETQQQVFIIARQETKVVKTDEFIHLTEGLVEESRKESGNLCYNVFQDIKNPTTIIFYEIWKSDADFKKHCESEHIKNYGKKILDLIEGEFVLDFYEPFNYKE